jgi:hypothetical protein
VPDDPSIDPQRTVEHQFPQPGAGETVDVTGPFTQPDQTDSSFADLPTIPGYRIIGW